MRTPIFSASPILAALVALAWQPCASFAAAANDPDSFYRAFVGFDDATIDAIARDFWVSINLVNLRDHIDQPCLDPPVLVQDANPSPPPTHRHSQFWPDPRTTEVGNHLVELLRGEPPAQLAQRGDGGHDQFPEAPGI